MLERIKEEILQHAWPERSAGLSLAILDYLAALPVDERGMLTYSNLLGAVHLDAIEGDFLVALNILVNSSDPVLSKGYLLIDDDGEYPISPEDISEALKHSTLIHPHTGEEISEFERYVFPYFYPTARLTAELA